MAAATGYRGRFAPSPTGPLHFGSLVAAMASYADARAAGGLWHLRIEDVDTPRARPGADTLILTALERLGFEWDGPVWYQSARHEAYENMVAHAREIGANAIVGMRYDATEFMQGATEVLAYGTAVHVAER